jgi:ABC-type multidrug transport system ATPase subunit
LLPSEIASPSGKSRKTGLIAGASVGAVIGLALLVWVFFYLVKKQGKKINGVVDGKLDDEADKLHETHIPATLTFNDVGYSLGGRTILQDISGMVKPGQALAIIGGSGAGKSTFLDILAGKSKGGDLQGSILINGVKPDKKVYRRMVGYVDQEDTLLGTLTVRETLMYSAMLRLPKSMSLEAKKLRVQNIMSELSIDHIADRLIGVPGKRGISGGEKRRVSIAQELVTSPSILFLDEPTSGLDAYNALLVVKTIVGLAKNFNRTVILTIHQPRPMIFSMFEQLLVLASGKMIYSGSVTGCPSYFDSVGYSIPPLYNVADYLGKYGGGFN